MKLEIGYNERIKTEIKEIIYKYPKIFIDIVIATPIEDTQYATDFIIKTSNRNIAVRVRESDCRYRDFTIRAKTKYDMKTEIDKLNEGYGDIYLYCWKGLSGGIKDYIILDINLLRTTSLLKEKRIIIMNSDGTGFINIKIDKLKEFGCLLINNIRGYKYQSQLHFLR